MKFQVGDKVILQHSEEEAVILDFINKKMALVESGGVSFPVYLDQIDFPYFKMFSEKKELKKKKLSSDDIPKEKNIRKLATHEGVFLSFVPVYDKDVFDDDVVEKLKVYLVNTNDCDFKLEYKCHYGEQEKFSLNNVLYAVSDFYLHDIAFEDLSDNPRLTVDFSLVKPEKKKIDHFETALKLKGKQMFKKIEEAALEQEASIRFLLFKEYPEKPEEEKLDLSALYRRGFYDASKPHAHLPPPRSVIDLHIEKITDNWKGLDNFSIMESQLAYFEKYFDAAKAHRMPNLIVIHGIGEGKLRDEIHERLRHKSGVKSFVNQHHPLYGFGATEIFFSY